MYFTYHLFQHGLILKCVGLCGNRSGTEILTMAHKLPKAASDQTHHTCHPAFKGCNMCMNEKGRMYTVCLQNIYVKHFYSGFTQHLITKWRPHVLLPQPAIFLVEAGSFTNNCFHGQPVYKGCSELWGCLLADFPGPPPCKSGKNSHNRYRE